MKNCRLNPNIVSFFKNFIIIISNIIGILFLVLAVLFIISSVIGYSMYFLDATDLMAYIFDGCKHEIDTLFGYIFYVGSKALLSILASSGAAILIFLLAYGIYSEAKESYRYKKRDLKYKFEGIDQPWYRILLSYIIVCDKTK